MHSYKTAVLIVQACKSICDGGGRMGEVLKGPYYKPTLPFLLASPSPPPSTRASCITAVICMPVGEGQRVFVMQKQAVGGMEEETEGRGEGGGDREQESAGYKEPPLPFCSSPHPESLLTAGEAQNTKEKPWGAHCWGCWPRWCACWLPAPMSRLQKTSTCRG